MSDASLAWSVPSSVASREHCADLSGVRPQHEEIFVRFSTEFVNVDELRSRKPTVKAWQKLKYAAERPMTFQVYGHAEDRLVETAVCLQELGPDLIDLNMGCYVKGIAERGAGAGMLCQPDKIARVFARLSQSLRIPVTGKIRLGWDDRSRNYITVAKILETRVCKPHRRHIVDHARPRWQPD
jgi:tRNA-dihydrouridine synthase